MLERRQHPRNRVYYGGMVAFNARNSTLACVVRNFSQRGAKIEFENSAMLPDRVDFEIERRGLSCRAHLVWRDQNAAGLVFSDAQRDERRHSAGPGAQAARDRTGKPAAPVAPRSASIRTLGRMSAVEGEGAAILAVASAPKVRRRRLRSILLALMAQYTIVAMVVGLSVAGILRYVVTPQIVAKFEAIEAAVKRLPAP